MMELATIGPKHMYYISNQTNKVTLLDFMIEVSLLQSVYRTMHANLDYQRNKTGPSAVCSVLSRANVEETLAYGLTDCDRQLELKATSNGSTRPTQTVIYSVKSSAH